MKNKITLFTNCFFLSAVLLLLPVVAIAGRTNSVVRSNTLASTSAVYEGNVVSPEGAWCWFADPRALHYENKAGTINSTYIGSIDVHGSIKATQHNFLTGKNNEVLIRSYFQPDDHDNPSFLILPDERVMLFYSRHTDEACFYYRISKKPGDITSLGAEMKIVTVDNTTYPSPFILSDDPTHIYLCWRGINWHPTIAKLSVPDAQDNLSIVWGPYQMVQSTGARPYCKYTSNGKDKLYLTYTTGHPDNEYPNYVYYNYVDINSLQLKDITGTVLSTIANGPHNVNKTTYPASYPNAMVDMPADQRDWVWQTTLDTDNLPVIAMVQISNDKLTHNYYYAKWTGSAWRKTFLANGGGKFHQTAGLELCYSGGMAIDDANPNIVYCSVPVVGTSGTVYEIMKYTIGTTGAITATEQITTNSTLNNIRPFLVKNSTGSPLRLVWMHGNYYDWIVSSSQPKGFPTAIHSDFALPGDNIDLANGLLMNEDFSGTITGTARTTGGVLVSTKDTYATLTASNSSAFSVSLTPYIYEGAYSGTILKMGNLTYGLNGFTVKPYVTIGTTTYNSTNLLGTSDVWQTTARGTGGIWYSPTKLKYFNLTLTYENGVLKVYRNGLIDQVIEVTDLTLSDITLGGFTGWVEDCRIYNRSLTQGEVKKLTETSLAYTFSSTLTKEVELDALSIPRNIYTDIVFPATSAAGNAIVWTSGNTSVVAASGLVTFPTTATSMTLTATANGVSKTFDITVYPRNLDNNKVFSYTFDGADLYTTNGVKYVADKSGNGNDATVYGNAVVNGTLDLTANTAAGFTTNGYATAPNGILNNLRSCTFLAKIKPASLTGAPRIYDFGSASTNSILLRASVLTAGLKYNSGTTILINSSTALTAGVEAKVAMTFDAKTKTTKIFVNGIETASATTITYEPWQLTAISSNTRNYIGRTQWWDTSVASSNVDFVGELDDFMLYNIVLTPTEIVKIQANTNTALANLNTPLVSVYPNPSDRSSIILINYDLTGNDLAHSKVQVLNSLGQTIKEVHPTTSQLQIDGISQSGLYFVKLTTGTNKVFTSKLVVK
ncbi:MAG: BNR-4 repeat-containing protein [Paludibacter sp.]|nr:BNR-4 repeat-containing protein [Paludibacter sp.]